jgi:O-antigen ligase
MLRKLPQFSSILLILAYFVNGSVIPSLSSSYSAVFSLLAYLSVVLAASCVLAGGGHVVQESIFFVASLGFSIIMSQHPQESFIRWIGWALLFVAVGPLMAGCRAAAFRRTAWYAICIALHGMALASMVWLIVGAPNYGYGVFTGIARHSMLLAPFAGAAAVLASSEAFTRRNIVWLFIAIAEAMVCVLAGSRLAASAMLLGVFIVGITSLRALYAAALIIICGLFITNVRIVDIEAAVVRSAAHLPIDVAQRYERGFNNTRESSWEERIQQFQSHPLTGMGFGIYKSAIADSDVANAGQDRPCLV